MSKPTQYSDAELRDTITMYFRFIEADRAGVKPAKKAAYKALVEKYGVRSTGSYESKCQNISSVMESLGLPYAKGLKPRGNAGAKLRLLITGIAVERGLI